MPMNKVEPSKFATSDCELFRSPPQFNSTINLKYNRHNKYKPGAIPFCFFEDFYFCKNYVLLECIF